MGRAGGRGAGAAQPGAGLPQTRDAGCGREHGAGADIDDSPAATDLDGDDLTYSLGGTDSAHFAIVAGSGQLQTKGALDHEKKASYSVVVTASDGTLTDTIAVTINVDLNEAPTFDDGLTASVNAAENQTAVATPDVTDLDGDDLTYRLDTAMVSAPATNDHALFTMTGAGVLTFNAAPDFEAARNSYTLVIEVRDSKDVNGDGDTDWDDSIILTINVTDLNEAPSFDDGETASVNAAENQTAVATPDVTDPEKDDLTYRLDTAAMVSAPATNDHALFTMTGAGVLTFNAAPDFEAARNSYTLVIEVRDSKDGAGKADTVWDDAVTLTVNVTDVDEPPDAPGDLAVSSTANGLTVTWTAPVMTGKPPLTGYDVEQRLRTSADDALAVVWGAWTDASHTGTAASASITGLTPEATYQVRVRAVNAEGNGQWAAPVPGVPGHPNRAPVYTSSSVTINVNENTALATAIGSAVTATDPDGDTLTYVLGGTDSGHFAIVAKTGQIKTSGALDYESKDSYSVTVTASDGTLSDSIAVTISVGDVAEPPDAPTGLKVGSTANGLTVTWTAPVMTGKPPLDGYDVEYRLRTSADDAVNVVWGAWTDVSHTGTAASASIGSLTPEAVYQVRVRAVNDDGNGEWAGPEEGVPEQPNRAPVYTSSSVTINVDENMAPATAIGSAVTATDPDGDSLTYALGGTDSGHFAIAAKTGQLKTSGALDYESKSSYSVTVTASDGTLSDSIAVTINVTDVAEPPDAPTGLKVGSTANGLTATWTAPAMTGKPALTGYDVEQRLRTSAADSVSEVWGVWTDVPHSDTTASASIGSLTPGETYQVRVRAVNAEGESGWAAPVQGVPGHPNRAPVYASSSVTINVNENTASATNIGSAVTATDPDGDSLTYSLGGTDSGHFAIDAKTGQIKTSGALDYESKDGYSVTVTASDGTLSDSIAVTINVTDVDEPPDAPADLAVGSTANGLTVTWTAPVMTGKPALTGYDVEHRLRTSAADAVSEVWGVWTDVPHSDTTASASIGSLTPGENYQVRVRGVNDEGDGVWAGPVLGVPGQPNRAPVYTDSSKTFSVDENTAPATNIGKPVTATDPDGDTLEYSLGSGGDDANFDIDSGSGQLKTKGDLDYETKSSYAVTVTAEDPSGLTDTIAVTINVTGVNEAPFYTGSGVTLKVDENTAPGAAIGSAVTATDPDGDTLEYSLAGTDSGHFAIVASSGQIKTSGALNHESQASYAVAVTAEDPSGLSADIPVTINVTDVNEPPSFADSAKTLDVAENTAPATAIGNPIVAIDPDGDLLTYAIEGTDAAHFAIVSGTGQLKTNGVVDFPTRRSRRAAPDDGTANSYRIVVSVSDGKDANGADDDTIDDTIDVTVRVRGGRQAPVMVDYDIDDDGLIELANLARLNAIRWDLNGDGAVDDSADQPSHEAAFPNAMPGMGCPDTDGDVNTPNCTGYELTANLDFDTDGSGDPNSGDTYWNGGRGWEPIASGANPLTAPLEGNGHTIDNLFIHRTAAHAQLGDNDVGLFAHIGRVNNPTGLEVDNKNNAVIRRLGLINVRVTGGAGTTGALVGRSAGGRIIACYSTGSVSAGPGSTGGLVGLNDVAGGVKDSYSSADVRAWHYAGGLVGGNKLGGYILSSYATGDVRANQAGGLVSSNRSYIKNTYATGDVQGKLAGGLVGLNQYRIWNSYSTGAVTEVGGDNLWSEPPPIGGLVGNGSVILYWNSKDPDRPVSFTPTVHDSYWDTAASGQNTSGWGGQGGAGKTAAELQTPTTFTGIYENWDDYHYLLDRGDSAMAWDLGDSSEYPALKADWDGDGEATVAEFGSQVRSARIARRSVGAEPVHQPPANLQVELQSDGSALVSWDTPDGAGDDASYSVRRRADAPNSEYAVVGRAVDGDDDGAAEYLDEDTLEAGQSYFYSVRAFHGYGEPLGEWTAEVSVSIPAAGAPPANNPPSFAAASAAVSVAENTATGTAIGDALTATDPDAGDTLTYTLGATMDDGHFAIDAGSGQIRTKGDLDYEGKDSYAVRVTATDGGGLADSIAVTITVTDVADTPPGQPDTPEIINVEETSFRVTWTAPAEGSSAITGYGIQYKLAWEEDSAYADVNPTPTGTGTGYNVVNRGGQTVAEGTSYAVRVRARNAEGWGPWSEAASVATAGGAAGQQSAVLRRRQRSGQRGGEHGDRHGHRRRTDGHGPGRWRHVDLHSGCDDG